MNQQSTTDPQTGLDKIFAALGGIGIRRRTDDKWIAGVCSGLADRLGVDPVIVRAALVLLSLVWGVGLPIYLVAWALLPNDKDQIVAQRALREGDAGSVVLVVVAALVLFGGSVGVLGGSWWAGGAGWGFPWGLAVAGLLFWWLFQQSRHRPDADQGVSAQQAGPAFDAGLSTGATGAGPTRYAQTTNFRGTSGSLPAPSTSRPAVPRKSRRRSGGPLMALLAIGLALVTFGSLNWFSDQFGWAGNHLAIALAGSLAAIGLLLVGLGVAGLRAGFVGFLAIVIAISAFMVAVVPSGIHLSGRVGDEVWTPRSVTSSMNYQLSAGSVVLDLTHLPADGLSETKIPAYVGLGDLEVLVPDGLTVRVVGHVGLGSIVAPGDRNDGDGGADVDRTITVGQGPTQVVVEAGVGLGQITVVKE